METELKSIKPEREREPESESAKDDDRPLLKSDANRTASSDSLEELEKKYAAFVRSDVYGPMGRGELPLAEKALLAIALVTLVPLRVALGTTILVVYYVICRLCTMFSAPNRNDEEEGQEDFAHVGGWRRAVIFKSGQLFSRLMLFVFGFYWISESYRDVEQQQEQQQQQQQPKQPDDKSSSQNGEEHEYEENERPGAIVSNHVSYVDILYHMSTSFPSFVAKRSVAKLPLVGLISKCLGCVYVQRESKSSDFKGVA
ncbi:hypothetical protein Tsubulata_034153, partial [Turnera subulata]